MEPLSTILKEELAWYYGVSGRGVNLRLFRTFDEEQRIYAVTASDYPTRRDPGMIVALARLVGEYVVIEEDNSDRPLVDRLLARRIAHEAIVLAYRGEAVPYPIAVV